MLQEYYYAYTCHPLCFYIFGIFIEFIKTFSKHYIIFRLRLVIRLRIVWSHADYKAIFTLVFGFISTESKHSGNKNTN